MRLVKIVATSSVLLLALGTAHAQYRCDCTSVVDTCSAEITARGSFLEIKTTEQQCARVDYFVDGQPFVSVVVDGEDRQNWLARTTNPRIMVQSCQVCRDASASPVPPPARTTAPPAVSPPSTPSDDDGKLLPLIASVPEYPQAAGGARGHVDLEFTVSPAGMVESPRVVAAEPPTVFDSAALSAISRRRYAADPARAPQVVQERIEFAPARPGGAAAASTGPVNQCVREDAVYNYGEMVDVSLINACAEPLLVFGCAQGIGKDLGRWVCSDSEQRGQVLVQAGDQRLGRTYAPSSASDFRSYTYTDDFSVTRAPNTQYWWLACAERDADCRSDARLWTRSVDRQDATVDPQARSRVAVASSD